MRAVLYITLIVLVLWGGVAWENAHAPVAVSELAVEAGEGTATPVAVKTETATKPAPTTTNKPTTPASPSVLAASDDKPSYDEEYVEALELAIHLLINKEREEADLKVLAYDNLLARVAAYHSTDMAEEDYFEHEDEKGCSVACRVTNADYDWQTVGENIFMVRRSKPFTVAEAAKLIVDGWMGSKGHRENILQPKFTYEGLGVVIEGDTVYATEVFARPR